ncbi:MAG: zinc carboxypeptidase [Lewinella sp.]|nr:zinc carboxypeptidase [Lewinella sp.]
MRKLLLLSGLLLGVLCAAAAQSSRSLTYYLPDIEYDANIPTPEDFLGWQIGDWHISHDLQLNYMRLLAASSDRIVLREYARSYEGRPLVNLIITSPENHARLDELQARHVALTNPDLSADIDLGETPLVLYQGYSIHGNEPSGGNAAPLVAYYLAAGQSPEIEALLEHTVILFDPCYNPDGFNRFSTWANIHKNGHMTADPQDREYDEAWPGGRTNHYWFDLNRDWLPQQLPESRGRIRVFHEWKPNILTDHHEMGTNSTFFFMPGEQTRIHPLTPAMNQELTFKIADFHAAALDEIGSLYYSREGYDDYYVGKGSTYPDLNGCIGILFEQASSRGHMQESDNGLLTFPFTIRNQVTTALSTFAAAVALKEEILGFQRESYQNARRESRADRRFGFVFGDDGDPARARHLIDILLAHQVEVYPLAADLTAAGYTYEAEHAYAVPLAQDQYRLIKAVFEPITEFEDSLFYDISTWTLPMACNLPYTTVGGAPDLGDRLLRVPMTPPPLPMPADYAYLLSWDDFYAPRAAYELMAAGLRMKVCTEPFSLDGKEFPRGTVFVPVQNQSMTPDEVFEQIKTAFRQTGLTFHSVSTGYASAGYDLGSRSYETMEVPRVAILVGEGVSSYDAGANWHFLDQRLGLPVTKLPTESLGGADLDRYNVIIMSDGWYSSLGEREAGKLKAWVREGGILIAQKRAVSWCSRNGLAQVEERKMEESESDSTQRPYNMLSRDSGGRVLGGAIFNTEVDLTHPLLYGFHRTDMPSFRRGNYFLEPADNPYATPVRYTEAPLLSGYVHPNSLEAIAGSAAIIVSGTGRGKTICMTDEPAFRAFWFGTSRLLANAIFFGPNISNGARESVRGE